MAATPRALLSSSKAVGLTNAGTPDGMAHYAAAFRNKALNEAGYIKGQNVTIEYHWLAGQFDRLPSLIADLVQVKRFGEHRRVPSTGRLQRRRDDAHQACEAGLLRES